MIIIILAVILKSPFTYVHHLNEHIGFKVNFDAVRTNFFVLCNTTSSDIE